MPVKNELLRKKVVGFDYSGEDCLKIAIEEPVPEGKINKWRLIWLLLTDKSFLWDISNVIKYALRHYQFYRGEGAGDVCGFKISKNFCKLWGKGE